ncbi:DinB family protein [Fibrella aquatica]|uniref:DinB family protein n=1 Tax=Fibrella aquatica TaxID=3242487 RepID=UPI003520372C
MSIIELLQQEMEMEAKTTRNMLSRIPESSHDWRPHPKSMTMSQLAVHIAEMPSWVVLTLQTNEIDFAAMDYTPTQFQTNAELLAIFEKSLADGKTALSTATETDLEPLFTLREGDKIYSTDTKGDFVRMSFSQIIHHRAQLGVYLRLLDIPIPGSYGPSADEPAFQ